MTENGLSKTAWDSPALAWARHPRLRDLKRREAEAVLSRNFVGRVAFAGARRVEIFPVHYVFVNDAIIGRTSLGTKYMTWLARTEVAFEVDEAEGLFEWRSVIVRGTVTVLRSRGTSEEHLAYEQALSAFRKLMPAAFTARDPTPQRAILFAIALEEITGRQASTH